MYETEDPAEDSPTTKALLQHVELVRLGRSNVCSTGKRMEVKWGSGYLSWIHFMDSALEQRYHGSQQKTPSAAVKGLQVGK